MKSALRIEWQSWDTEFFGFGVGRIDGPVNADEDLRRALKHAQAQGMHLVYAHCLVESLDARACCESAGGNLVDHKQTYSLTLPSEMKTSECFLDVTDMVVDSNMNQQLHELAWQSAHMSRFRVDAQMPTDAWKRLYSLWIERSVDRTLSDAVFIERIENKIQGMITVCYRGARGKVGLIAVKKESQGRGIGRRLLNAAANRCITKGCQFLDVVTQRANVAACRAYTSAGYRLIDEQLVFHFWLNK